MFDCLTPKPHQIVGAEFLACRSAALLADEPRVGKTGAAIIAADYAGHRSIVVVTTASGRGVWRQAIPQWEVWGRSVGVLGRRGAEKADVVIVGWGAFRNPTVRAALARRTWDLLILDESHYAKSFDAFRTRAVYGEEVDGVYSAAQSLKRRCGTVWCLTGTPMANSPADLYPMLRALAPERLGGLPGFAAYRDRFCEWHPMKVGRGPYTKRIEVVTGGRNLDDLRQRLDGFRLVRTQQDVGIGEPFYEILPVEISASVRREIERDVDAAAVLAAAENGSTKDLEMHLGPVRRMTGTMKIVPVADAVKDAFACGLDRVVLMAWHRDVIDGLMQHLADFGVVKVDGSTSAADRQRAVSAFASGAARVFIGQILAAGEAIDLSASAELWFVEPSFVPAHMKQASLRVTNLSQTRQVLVRVCVLEGSIDEAVQRVLLKKWTAIREVMT